MDTAFDQVVSHLFRFRDELLKIPQQIKEQAFDIRVKAGQPVCISGKEGIRYVRQDGTVSRQKSGKFLSCSTDELQELFYQLCGQSVFSHENEIRQGYLTLSGNYRVGLCGTAVLESGKIKNIRDITSLVFRIPREKPGCADMLFRPGLDLKEGVLIAGEPSSGKTTFLRDLITSISFGRFGPCSRLAVLDERGELGGGYDLGPGADILRGYPKSAGFDVAIRMLSPEFLVCDELSTADLDAVKQAVFSGVALIATVHASRDDFLKRPLCRSLLDSEAFGNLVFLQGRRNPGQVSAIESVEISLAAERIKKRKPMSGYELSVPEGDEERCESAGGGYDCGERLSAGIVRRETVNKKGEGAA